MVNKSLLFGVAIVCLLLFLYIADIQKLYFLNDDNIYIPASRNLSFLYGTSFRPVSDITLLTDYSLWGTNATGYHFTNFFLHVITTVLVFFLANTIFIKYSAYKTGIYKSILIAVLFFFYPFHSEAVFWIIGRGGLLGALFGVASLLLYINREKSKWCFVCAVLLFLTGAFAYETIWIVPFIIVVITYFDIKLYPDRKKDFVKDAIIFWAFFILYLIIRRSIIGEIGGSPYGSSAIMKFDIPALIRNYNIMIARSFLPPMQSVVLLVASYCCLLLLAMLFFRNLIIRKRLSKTILLSVAGLLISFLPVLTLGVDSHDSESERFLYFPSIFAVFLLVEAIFEMGKSFRQRMLLFSILLCTEFFYLSRAAGIYQISSKVASVSMAAVAGLDDNSNIYCIDLPVQYKGGLIFRNGFNEAVSWLTGKNRATIIRVSEREMIKPSLDYKIRYLTFKNLLPAEAAAVLKNVSPKQLFSEHDVVLKWTDSSLLVIK